MKFNLIQESTSRCLRIALADGSVKMVPHFFDEAVRNDPEAYLTAVLDDCADGDWAVVDGRFFNLPENALAVGYGPIRGNTGEVIGFRKGWYWEQGRSQSNLDAFYAALTTGHLVLRPVDLIAGDETTMLPNIIDALTEAAQIDGIPCEYPYYTDRIRCAFIEAEDNDGNLSRFEMPQFGDPIEFLAGLNFHRSHADFISGTIWMTNGTQISLEKGHITGGKLEIIVHRLRPVPEGLMQNNTASVNAWADRGTSQTLRNEFVILAKSRSVAAARLVLPDEGAPGWGVVHRLFVGHSEIEFMRFLAKIPAARMQYATLEVYTLDGQVYRSNYGDGSSEPKFDSAYCHKIPDTLFFNNNLLVQ